jgi:3-oxoacyl-[acyl-carrier-protein] synthase III
MATREIALQILGTGEHIPSHRVDSQDIDRRFGKPAGWTFGHTGVRYRYFAEDHEDVVTMGAAAARGALRSAGANPSEIDAIIAVGSVPSQAIPCTAVLLQRALGLAGTGIPAFDINATCLGFLAALDLIAQGISTGRYRSVLIVAAERASLGLRQHDSTTAGLFGDGAGAVIVGAPTRRGAALLSSHYQTFSEGADFCQVRSGGTGINPHTAIEEFLDGTFFEMHGRQMYRLAAEKMPRFLDDLLGNAGVTLSEVRTWVPHQASGHAISHMQRALGLSPQRFVSTLETSGNQVSASLPIALHRGIQSAQIKPGELIALVGTGAGLSFAGSVLRY